MLTETDSKTRFVELTYRSTKLCFFVARQRSLAINMFIATARGFLTEPGSFWLFIAPPHISIEGNIT